MASWVERLYPSCKPSASQRDGGSGVRRESQAGRLHYGSNRRLAEWAADGAMTFSLPNVRSNAFAAEGMDAAEGTHTAVAAERVEAD